MSLLYVISTYSNRAVQVRVGLELAEFRGRQKVVAPICSDFLVLFQFALRSLFSLIECFRGWQKGGGAILLQFLRLSGPFCQGEIIYPPPPLPPFLAIRHFSGEGGGGVYFEAPRQEFYAPPPFYTPPTPRRVILGVGGWACIKFGPVFFSMQQNEPFLP